VVDIEVPFGTVAEGVEGEVDFDWILVDRRGVTEAIAIVVTLKYVQLRARNLKVPNLEAGHNTEVLRTDWGQRKYQKTRHIQVWHGRR
jgi:hypothetical protein